MDLNGRVQCPFCGQSSLVEIDPSLDSQQLTTDCEICCRPFEVHCECENGEILHLEAHPA